ncbi:MAG TPA: phosphatase PAP2 family protein [Chloroflexota bacterium]|nr:phosphatase PAP2 family protein [Chloroflexota bacterium]
MPLTIVGLVTEWAFSGQVIVVAAAAACLVLLVKRRWLLALSAALAFPLMATEVVLKFLINEPPASRYLQVRSLFAHGGPAVSELARGFPSGHGSRIGFAIGWLALLVIPARYRLPAAGVALILTLFVAWTRVYVGDHSLLEMIAGLLLSLVFLLPAWTLIQAARNKPAR